MTLAVEARVGFARRAESLHRQGDSAEAMHLLTTGVRLFPGDVTALVVLAQVCRDTDRAEEARMWLESALRLDPGCPAARALWQDASREEEIREAADAPRAHARGPAHAAPAPAVVPASGTFTDETSADASRAFARPPAATPSFSFPVREEDEEPEIDENSAPHVATVTLAEIYLQQGLKEQAAQIYRQLLELQPENDSVRGRLQEILREIEGS